MPNPPRATFLTIVSALDGWQRYELSKLWSLTHCVATLCGSA
jgi:hypothetical protein